MPSKASDRYIYELSREIDLDIRDGYYGGRCDIYKYGQFKNVYYYDFTSLYPYVCAKNTLPVGKPIKVDGGDIDIKSFYGFIRCKVTTNPEVLPLHGIKNDNKLTFANHTQTEIMLFSEEIKYGLTLGYKYEYIYGYKFNRGCVLNDIMKDGFLKKAENKRLGKTVLEKTWKIVINSCYGFFGLRWMDKRSIKIMNNN